MLILYQVSQDHMDTDFPFKNVLWKMPSSLNASKGAFKGSNRESQQYKFPLLGLKTQKEMKRDRVKPRAEPTIPWYLY